MRIIWSEAAENDLDTIVEYLAKENLQDALDMDDLLQDCAERLIAFPALGKPGRIPGTREFIAHKNFILVYAVVPELVQIAAVLHCARQWPAL